MKLICLKYIDFYFTFISCLSLDLLSNTIYFDFITIVIKHCHDVRIERRKCQKAWIDLLNMKFILKIKGINMIFSLLFYIGTTQWPQYLKNQSTELINHSSTPQLPKCITLQSTVQKQQKWWSEFRSVVNSISQSLPIFSIEKILSSYLMETKLIIVTHIIKKR